MKFGNNKADGNLFFCSAVMKGYTNVWNRGVEEPGMVGVFK